MTEPEIICRHCGENLGFWRGMEVSGDGWMDVEFSAAPDGSIVEEHRDLGYGSIQDIEWDYRNALAQNYGCSSCSAEAYDFMDLVKIKEESAKLSEEDRIRYAQKHPIPGQMKLA